MCNPARNMVSFAFFLEVWHRQTSGYSMGRRHSYWCLQLTSYVVVFEKILSRCGDAAVRGIDWKRSRSGKLRSGEEMRGKAQRLQDVFIKFSTRLIYQHPLSPMLGLGIHDGGLSLGCLRLEISQQYFHFECFIRDICS